MGLSPSSKYSLPANFSLYCKTELLLIFIGEKGVVQIRITLLGKLQNLKTFIRQNAEKTKISIPGFTPLGWSSYSICSLVYPETPC
jgi:hypothetical protein